MTIDLKVKCASDPLRVTISDGTEEFKLVQSPRASSLPSTPRTSGEGASRLHGAIIKQLEGGCIGLTEEKFSQLAIKILKQISVHPRNLARLTFPHVSLGTLCSSQFPPHYRQIFEWNAQGKKWGQEGSPLLAVLDEHSAYCGNTIDEIVAQNVADALAIVDEAVSFRQYRGEEPPHLEEELFKGLDEGATVSEAVGQFLYKHIALYRGSEYLTWIELAREWAVNMGKVDAFNTFKAKFPLHSRLDPGRLITPTKTPEKTYSFREYAFEETAKAFEKILGIEFDQETRGQLIEDMSQDLAFRLDLVYHTGVKAALLDSTSSNRWFVAVRRLLYMQKNYEFGKKNGAKFFRWILLSKPLDLLDKIDKSTNLTPPGDKKQLDSLILQVAKRSMPSEDRLEALLMEKGQMISPIIAAVAEREDSEVDRAIKQVERALKIELHSEIEDALRRDLSNKSVRQNIQYHLTFKEHLVKEPPKVTDRGYKQLMIIRRFLRMQHNYTFSEENGSTLLCWIFYARSQPLIEAFDNQDLVEGKKEIDRWIEKVKKMSGQNQDRFALLLTCKDLDPETDLDTL